MKLSLKNNFIRSLQRLDIILLLASVFLFIFGVTMILSASNVEAFVRYDYSPYHYFVRQIIILVFGTCVTLPILFVPTSNYKRTPYVLMAVVIGALLVLFSISSAVNNSVSWINLGLFNLQPSEIAKVALIVFIAFYFERNKERINKDFYPYIPLLVIGILVGLIVLQPDLGTAIIVGGIGLFMFLKINFDDEKKRLIKNGLIGLVLLVGAVFILFGNKMLSTEQLERLNFTYPCDRYAEEGYQVCNGYIAINNGGLFGVGIGDSTQKYLYIPEAYTDFIFAIVMEEIGLVFSVLLVFIPYMIILWRIIRISNESHTIRGKLITYGVVVYLLLHIGINLLGLFGWAPYTGVPLPFLSYGGSFAISLIFALSLVQRVNIENKLYKSNLK